MNTTELGIKLFQLFHNIPEKSGCEEKTRELLTKILRQLDHIYIIYSGRYGIIASFHCKAVYSMAIRAEMDAVELPDGRKFHSCGHDGHMAALLTTMLYIDKQLKKDNYNDCLFIFQSAEEFGNGAKGLSTILKNKKIKVKEFYAIHNAPEIFCNQLAVRSKETLANNITKKFTVHFYPKGHFGNSRSVIYGVEPIIHYLYMQNIKDRYTKYEIGNLTSNGTISSAPNRMSFTLSIRSNTKNLSLLIRAIKQFHTWLQKQKFVSDVGCKTINVHKQVINSKRLVDKVKKIQGLSVIEAPPTWSSDDFFEYSVISQEQLYFFVGSFLSKNTMYLHTEEFTMNPGFIKSAIKILLYLLRRD